MSTERALTGFRFVETLYDDTLQAIAARELGDAARWVDIVNINGLQPPYLTGDPQLAGETVKLFGQLLLVPAATAQFSAATDPARVFGSDVALTGGLLTADENGDMATVSGRANLRQALQHRLDTPLASLLFHPGYGCGVHAIKGQVSGPTASLLSAEFVRGALLAETRVDTVLSVSAGASGDAIPIVASIQPIAGTSIDLSTVA